HQLTHRCTHHLTVFSFLHSSTPYFFSFFFYCYGAHRDLHSFPTRRSSDLAAAPAAGGFCPPARAPTRSSLSRTSVATAATDLMADRKSTRLNSSHVSISYAVFCLKKKKTT